MNIEILDERKTKVLKIIVEDYIETAEPVGSTTVTKRHHLSASPATIRFDMADLEKMGFIKKPHTSAGRVPSDKGYRFFIDQILKITDLSQKEKEAIMESLRNADKDEIMEIAGMMLSKLCDNPSVIVSSKKKNISVNGLSKLLRHPEFGMVEKACRIIETLEDHDTIMNLLYDNISDERQINIKVGNENSRSTFRQCSIAATTYGNGGVISIIGPTRMHYEKIMSALSFFSNVFEDFDL